MGIGAGGRGRGGAAARATARGSGTIAAAGLLAALLIAACAGGPVGRGPADPGAVPVEIPVFRDIVIHFAPGDSARHDTVQVWHTDNGRLVHTVREMRLPAGPFRLLARVTTRPIPKDVQEVHDRWDRAGNVRLSRPGLPDVELVKFVTAYGGETTHEVDVTRLAPLIAGTCTFRGFVDTWTDPGWEMDFTLVVEPAPAREAADWVVPICFEESVTAERLRAGPLRYDVAIPGGAARVVLEYLVSGHCTDGRDADEFETKDNVLVADGREIFRVRPWRDDCLRFRAINPYCRRWSDGSWSSDFSRSGWCPGDAVLPLEADVTAAFPPGDHAVELSVEGARPKGDDGHFGYWRISARLFGWNGGRQ